MSGSLTTDVVRPSRGGRPRDPSRDSVIRAAIVKLLGDVGYGALTMDAVASEAGVGKATIYRRWRTKEELVRVSRGRDYRGYNFVSRTDERAIEVHIANLRRKLARSEGDPELITTVRGVGFRIMPRRVDPGQERASG